MEYLSRCDREVTLAVPFTVTNPETIQDSIIQAKRVFGTDVTFKQTIDSERTTTIVVWTNIVSTLGTPNIGLNHTLNSRDIDIEDTYYMVQLTDWISKTAKLELVTDYELSAMGYEALVLDFHEPTPITVAFPTPNALTDALMMKNGIGISGSYAASSNDNELELSIVPTIPGRRVLVPDAMNEAVYSNAKENKTGLVFAVTMMNDEVSINRVTSIYDITLIVGNGQFETSLRLDLRNGKLVWVSETDPTYILTDSFVDSVTVQNGTRVSFLTDAGLLPDIDTNVHECTLMAVNKLTKTDPIITNVIVKLV